jgi:UDP-N-acetylglucosamine 2-epimerase (non-hydrolysing)
MKAAPLLKAIKNGAKSDSDPGFEQLLVHTGQHYDREMADFIFRDLELPPPDIHLGIGSGSHARQTARVLEKFEEVLLDRSPDLVVVVGDVNSTMAGAIAAKKLNITVAHVEAGLRSHDMTMPEEVNRKVTDAISDILFTTDRQAGENLKSEGVAEERIHFVGNVMIDSLLAHRERAAHSDILGKLKLGDAARATPYALVTLHRPSNVDRADTLRGICQALAVISRKMPVIFPCHPRTARNIDAYGLNSFFTADANRAGYITRLEPLGYLDFLHLQSHAAIVLTDSGGIQEEATILGVPCLTLRENTERPITIEQGTNQLVGHQTDDILSGVEKALAGNRPVARSPELWDGKSADRIAKVLAHWATAGIATT